MAISFIGEAFGTSTASNSAYTLTKPSGAQQGDLLIALVAVYCGASGAELTITPPTGWTRELSEFATNRTAFPTQIAVLSRVVGASDPASWNGSYNRSLGEAEVTVVACYRGAEGILASASSNAGFGTSFNCPSVNNTLTGSWRLTVGGCTGIESDSTFGSTETTLRRRAGITDGTPDSMQGGIWDSGAPVATGSSNKALNRSSGWDSVCGATVIINAANTDPSMGDINCLLGKVQAEAVANAHADGVIDADLPLLQAAMEGEGVPQPSSGGFVCSTPSLTSAGVGGTDILGQVNATLGVVAGLVGETVPFGIRVIAVEAEDRTIVVPSRGVEG